MDSWIYRADENVKFKILHTPPDNSFQLPICVFFLKGKKQEEKKGLGHDYA